MFVNKNRAKKSTVFVLKKHICLPKKYDYVP